MTTVNDGLVVLLFFFPDGPGTKEQTALMLPTLGASIKKQNDGNIRRPPNACILFSNEWLHKFPAQYPDDRNKDIACSHSLLVLMIRIRDSSVCIAAGY
jgi:hypothetical protein